MSQYIVFVFSLVLSSSKCCFNQCHNTCTQ